VCRWHRAEVIFVLKHQVKRTITLIHTVKNLVKLTGHLGRHLIFLICTAHDDAERVIRQWPLKALASSHGARIQTSRSSSVVRITGMSFGWIGATTAYGDVVRKL